MERPPRIRKGKFLECGLQSMTMNTSGSVDLIEGATPLWLTLGPLSYHTWSSVTEASVLKGREEVSQ